MHLGLVHGGHTPGAARIALTVCHGLSPVIRRDNAAMFDLRNCGGLLLRSIAMGQMPEQINHMIADTFADD